MHPAEAPRRNRTWHWAAGLTAAVLWAAALAWFARARPGMAGMAAGGAGYAAVLAGLTLWLGPRSSPEDRLRASGRTAPLWVWDSVAVAVLVWAFLYGFAFGGVNGGVRIPVLTPWIAALSQWRLVRGVDGTTLLNFVSFAVLPAAVLLAWGARPREMGLCAPVPGTRAATIACLVLPLGFVVWGFAQGKLTVSLLLVLLLHDFLSNGISEEFMCRALFLAPLRAMMPTAWAVVVQALLFGLIHLGGAIPEEGGDPIMAAAAAVALNFPMGLALGVIAVRTGSLALPTAIHVAGHLIIDVLR